MDESFFKQKIFDPLHRWSTLGEDTNEAGTLLIGHVPHIAPKAYLHIIYAGLDETGFQEFEDFLGYDIPQSYRLFLQYANGLDIFSGALSVNGYYPVEPSFPRHPHNYPKSIGHAHTGYKWRTGKQLIMGFYKFGSSFPVLMENGTIVRYQPKTDAILSEWGGFDDWITSEVRYLEKFFDDSGKMICDGKDLYLDGTQY